jgi:hypothetical protein
VKNGGIVRVLDRINDRAPDYGVLYGKPYGNLQGKPMAIPIYQEVAMAKKVTHKPPSRERYEKSNPTVSCRVPKELYDQLARIKNREGKSFADILKLGLGEIEDKKEELKLTRKNGFDEGYREGYAKAESLYKVNYHCHKCNQVIAVTSDLQKESIDLYMSSKWGHSQCPVPVVNRISRKS